MRNSPDVIVLSIKDDARENLDFLLTFVVVGLNAHDPASADHKFTCAPHDQNGARLPYDGPFICGQILCVPRGLRREAFRMMMIAGPAAAAVSSLAPH